MWFPICSNTNYGAIRYRFREIQHFRLHGKPYSDPQFWGFWGKRPQIVMVEISEPQKGVPYADPRLLNHFGHFLRFPFGLWPSQGSCLRKWMTLNSEFQGQPRSNVTTEFTLAAFGFLFAPNTRLALISDRLATSRHLSLCAKSGNG